MKTLVVTILVLLCCGFSCNKDVIGISGITMTDAIGNPMGDADPSDWTLDAGWSSAEESVFTDISPASLTGTMTSTATITPAYPNPCTNEFGFMVNVTQKCAIRMALVDRKLAIYWSGSQVLNPGFNHFMVSPDPARTAGGLYRLYYVFDAEGQLIFQKGHGDVRFQ